MHKILIDGSKLSFDVAGGVVNYINNLFSHYQIHEKKFQIESTMLRLNKEPNGESLKNRSNLTNQLLILNYLQYLKFVLFGVTKDYVIFHSPYMFLPPKRKGKINILTVHDMTNFERPFSLRNKLREFALHIAIKRADYYVCVSETTKSTLQTYFPKIKDDQILVSHLGIDRSFLTLSESTKFHHHSNTPFLLYVGQRSGYKNFNSLLEFMATSSWGKKLTLLCVGGGKFNRTEEALLCRHNLDKSIFHVGYTSTEDLKYLYQKAKALVYTSLSEGFGLPILEAMASGCPVICGNFSSMKEISGRHGILVNDFSVQSLDAAVKRANAFTKKEIEDAKSYASGFTWEQTALKTLSYYAKLSFFLTRN
jgi:glycosyltransferase involved in cell wall biosynthesis